MSKLFFNSCVIVKAPFCPHILFCLNSVGIFFCQTTLSKMFYFKSDILPLCQSTMLMTFINNEQVKNDIVSE